MDQVASTRSEAAGITGFPGPFAVGRYAGELREKLRGMARVCLLGEVTGARIGTGPNVYFELRDRDGAMPCAMWRTDFDRLALRGEDFRDGIEVVVAGGCDFYVGSASASPRFTFRVTDLRLAGEGDLLARLERLRRQLASEGLFEPQKLLPRPGLPRSIGVVTARGSAAARDFVAGLERRSWRGRLVWAHAPVQDRRAAPAIATAIRDLAAAGGVDAIVVTRGGGSIADLWAFCDETLCRTVALLPVPVISAVGHDVDRTLIDDVAAVCCSTPTHAAEAAVRVDCAEAVAGMLAAAGRIESCGRRAVLDRGRELAARSRAPREHIGAHRRRLQQEARELRAASRRGLATRREFQRRIAGNVIGRKLRAASAGAARQAGELAGRTARLERAVQAGADRRAEWLLGRRAALRAHDPERTLERGYALISAGGGEPLTSAAELREAGRFTVRMSDGEVAAESDQSTSMRKEHHR